MKDAPANQRELFHTSPVRVMKSNLKFLTLNQSDSPLSFSPLACLKPICGVSLSAVYIIGAVIDVVYFKFVNQRTIIACAYQLIGQAAVVKLNFLMGIADA